MSTFMQSQSEQQRPSLSRDISYNASIGAGPTAISATTATTKKRKRLQRACTACHRAKRRCQGGLPCDNCDFSGRVCSYSDAQGKAVSPTKRTLKPSEAALQEQQQMQCISSSSARHSSLGGMPGHPSMYGSPSSERSHQSSPSISPHDTYNDAQRPRLEPGLESRRELLSIFFSRLQPMSSVFDEISFLRDLSSMEVSQVLLFSMYAVSASHAFEAHRQLFSSGNTRFSKLVAEAGDGSRYAKEARRLLSLEDEHTGLSLFDGRPNLEAAQSLYLLAFYEFNQGHYFKASTYIQLSSKHITGLSTEVDRSSHPMDGSNDDSESRALQRRNIKRLTCLVTAMDVSIALMTGQSMSTKQCNVEAAIDASTRFSCTDDDDEETTAMIQLLNISLILNTAIELVQSKSTQSFEAATKQASLCQTGLQSWAERLPLYLRFDEYRLKHVEQVLNERSNRPRSPTATLQMNKGSAVCWILMHSMAETATLLLKELTILSDRVSRLEACKSLVLLLEQTNPSSLPRLFASFSIAVLYSVSSMATDYSQDREWAPIRERARSFAVHSGLGDSIWASMASWWRKRSQPLSPQRSPTSSTSSRRMPLPPSPSMTTATSHRSSLPSPPQLSTGYHYLPPLASMATSAAPSLPPLRLPLKSEQSARHFWDQPQRPAMMTVNPS